MGQDREPPREQAGGHGGLSAVVPAPLDAIGQDDKEEEFTCSQKLYLLLEEPHSSSAARGVSYIVLVTIVASVVCFVLQTEPTLEHSVVMSIIEVGSLAIFTIEYALRLLVCTAFGDQTRCQFIRAPANIIDLAAIFPFYVLDQLKEAKPLRVLRAVRLVRIFRIFKLSKYSAGMGIMADAMKNAAKPLSILSFILFIGIIFYSSLVYNAEKLSCPVISDMSTVDRVQYQSSCAASTTGWANGDFLGFLCCNEYGSPNDFESIPDTFWWSMVTMTTVGYGDKAPKTPLGRTLGCVTMISGIVLISLPVAIVGTKFQEAYEYMEASLVTNCGESSQAMAPALECPSSSGDQVATPTGNQSLSQTARFLEPGKSDKKFELLGDQGAIARKPSLDRSIQNARALREKLKKLDGKRGMSKAAQGQTEMLLELLDHLEKVDKKLSKLSEKDTILDTCLRRDFVSLSRDCGSVNPSSSSSSTT